MNFVTRLRLLLIAAAAASLLSAPGSQAGVIEFPDEVNAKLARSKAKMRRMSSSRRSGDEESGRGGADCGSIDIGNTQTNGRGGPREITVIVTGDVVNANNNCR